MNNRSEWVLDLTTGVQNLVFPIDFDRAALLYRYNNNTLAHCYYVVQSII